MKWQPIESIPRGVTVLLCSDYGSLAIGGKYSDRGVEKPEGGELPNARYWMLLPKPPAPEKGGRDDS